MQGVVSRDIAGKIHKSLELYPGVIIKGARQVGKTVCSKQICSELGGRYVSLVKAENRSEASRRPVDFLTQAPAKLLVVDEFQRVPRLMEAVMQVADEQGRNGMFLLTGSSDRYRFKKNHETAVGRVSSHFMRPFSQLEIEALRGGSSQPVASGGKPFNMIDAMLAGESPDSHGCDGLEERVATGGYPKAVLSPRRRKEILEDYVENDLVDELSSISASQAVWGIPDNFGKLAWKTGMQMNVLDFAKESELPPHTARRMVSLLANSFVIEPLPSLKEKISPNKFLRKPKMHLNDSGLACALLGLNEDSLRSSPIWGMLLESFVLSELRKHLAASTQPRFTDLRYFGDTAGFEVDLVIADLPKRNLFAFEVKATSKVNRSDWYSLYRFMHMSKGRCKRAVLVYTGDEVVKLDENIEAWPVSFLWKWNRSAGGNGPGRQA